MTTYTPAQAEAIACLDEPLQIIACAGSGKTQVISQRIAAILSLPGVEPRNVVAFTFTEKAAAELQGPDLLDPRAGGRRPARAGRDVCRDDARVRPGPAAAARPGDLQVLGADGHHRRGSSSTGTASRSGLDRLPDQLCRHAAPAALHPFEALPAGDERPPRGRGRRRPRPGRRAVVVQRLHEADLREGLLRLHGDDQPGRSVPRGRRGRR